MTLAKPLPPIDPQSRPYWEACNEGRLVLQHCLNCGYVQHYHRVLCSHCAATDLVDLEASGAGSVKSFTVIRRAVSSAFDADVPYVVALIELAEGPVLVTNLVDSPLEDIAIGEAVELTFERRSEDINLPQFRLVGRGS